MPDWISHVLIGLIICEIFRIKPKSLVLLGALLPDIILKVELIHNFIPIGDNLFWLFMPLHTPIGNLLVTFLLLPVFNYNKKKTFFLITIGWISHLLSDMMTKHFIIGQFLLFPLSWKTSGFGMVWPEEFYLILIPLLVVYLIFLTLISRHI